MKIIINKIIRLYHLLNIFIVYVQKRGIGTYHKVLGFFTAPFFWTIHPLKEGKEKDKMIKKNICE